MSILQRNWHKLSKLEKWLTWNHLTHGENLDVLAKEIGISLEKLLDVKENIFSKRRQWLIEETWNRQYLPGGKT